MKVKATIECWDDGQIGIYASSEESGLPITVYGIGKTVKEAKESLMSCVEDYKEVTTKLGEVIPEEMNNLEFEYVYDFDSFLEDLDFIDCIKLSKAAGVDSLSHVSSAQKDKVMAILCKASQRAAAFA